MQGKIYGPDQQLWAAISLACTSVYNMIEDCYKTKILPAAVHLKRQQKDH